MTPADLREAVAAEARTWWDTPYHHLGDVKGAGVDCAMLLVRVYAACGLIPADTDPRPYAHDWHLSQDDQVYLGWLDRFAQRLPDDAEPQLADIAVWHFGKTFSHGAIVMGRGWQAPILHALMRARRVCWGQLDDATLSDRPWRLYRMPALAEGGC